MVAALLLASASAPVHSAYAGAACPSVISSTLRPTMTAVWDQTAWFSTTAALTQSADIAISDDTWHCPSNIDVLVRPYGAGAGIVFTNTALTLNLLTYVERVEMRNLPLVDGASNVLTVTYRPQSVTVPVTVPVTDLYTATQVFTLNYDATPPLVGIVGISGNAFSKSLTITVSDATSGIERVTSEPAFFSSDLFEIKEGTLLTFTVNAQDHAGNRVKKIYGLTYDTVSPTIDIAGGGDTGSYFTQSLTITMSDVASGVANWSLDIRDTADFSYTAVQTTSPPFVLPFVWVPENLADGAQVTVAVSAQDVAGNTATKTQVLKYDGAAPVITIAGVVGDFFTQGLTITVSDLASGVAEWSLDIRDAAEYSYTVVPTVSTPFSWTPENLALAEGAKITVTVMARDAMGNSVIEQRVLRRDVTPPSINVGGASGDAFRGKLTFVVSDVVAGVQPWHLEIREAARVLTTSVHTETSPIDWTPTDIAVGDRITIAVTAEDFAGNTTTRILTLIYDTVAPTISVSGFVGKIFVKELSFIVRDDTSGIGLRPLVITTTAAGAVTSTEIFAAQPWHPNGRFKGRTITVSVAAYDVAGNVVTWMGRFLYSPQALVPIAVNHYCNSDALPVNGYDCWEPNNWFAEATPIDLDRAYVGAVYRDTSVQDPVDAPSASDRRDFYQVRLAGWHSYEIVLTPIETSGDANGDIDLYLYASSAASLAAFDVRSDRSGAVEERINVECTVAPAVYRVLVAAYATSLGRPKSYRLTITDWGECDPTARAGG